MTRKSALGKGIGSLITKTSASALMENYELDDKLSKKLETKPQSSSGVQMVPVDVIRPNSSQPRKIFKEADLQELSDSIKENGIIQPLTVCETDNGFELIAGERRLRASKMAELTHVPVVIKRVTERQKLAMAIVENIQRSDLNCVEEGLAYYQLMEDYNLTQEEVAKMVGKNRSTIANFLRVLRLPRNVVDLLQKEHLSFGHAKVLAASKDSKLIQTLAKKAFELAWSVRELESQMEKSQETRTSKPEKKAHEDVQALRDNLEEQTGLHIKLKMNSKSKGNVTLPFTNEEEFNKIYSTLMNLKKS